MSQDIKHIREQLKSCEEVDSPYDIRIGQHVKYITLKMIWNFFMKVGSIPKWGITIYY